MRSVRLQYVGALAATVRVSETRSGAGVKHRLSKWVVAAPAGAGARITRRGLAGVGASCSLIGNTRR